VGDGDRIVVDERGILVSIDETVEIRFQLREGSHERGLRR
jgi:hypothetical protein